MFLQPNYPSSITRLHEKEVVLILFRRAPPEPPFGNWPDHICIASSGPAVRHMTYQNNLQSLLINAITVIRHHMTIT